MTQDAVNNMTRIQKPKPKKPGIGKAAPAVVATEVDKDVITC